MKRIGDEIWMTIQEACEISGRRPNSYYVLHHYDSKRGFGGRFRKIDGRLYINSRYVNATRYDLAKEETHREFEKLYFRLVEMAGNDHAAARLIAPIIGKKEFTVYMYLKKVFVNGTERMLRAYIDAMRSVVTSLDERMAS